MKPVTKKIKYNFAQLLFLLTLVKITVLEWGRGTGKSTILAKRIIDCVTSLPRSTGGLVGSSFTQIKSRTLPSTISGLEMHGWFKDVHYVVGKAPPKKWGWPEAYQPPLDYKNAICFYNGTVLVLISQDHSSSSGRGLNLDWVIGDEAALLDKEKFETDVLLTNRGNLNRVAGQDEDGNDILYKDVPLHHSILLASTTPISVTGRWFLAYEEEALRSPKEVCFLRASAHVNMDNLGSDYFKKAKSLMSELLYNAEVLNIRLPKIANSFYPKLDQNKHTYNEFSYLDIEAKDKRTSFTDEDVDKKQPLICGIDWGSRINTMVVAQGDSSMLRFVNNLHVDTPNIVDDLIDKFIRYYSPHECKQLYMFYDPTGNIRTANSRETVAQQVRKRLNKAGWEVYLMTEGFNNEYHEHKYNLWNNILQQEADEITRYPKISINLRNCKDLWVSMSTAPAKAGRTGGIVKDKSSEKSKKIEQRHATHYSDGADVIIVGMFSDLMFAGYSPGEPMTI